MFQSYELAVFCLLVGKQAEQRCAERHIRKRNRIVPNVFSLWIQWIPSLSGEVKELGTKVTSQTSHFQTIDRLAFQNFIYWFIYFGCAESSLLRGLFSICGEQGLLSSCSAQASHCGGFCLRARDSRPMDFSNYSMWAQWLRLLSSRSQPRELWCRVLVTPQCVGSSWIRDWTRVSCIGRQILYH